VGLFSIARPLDVALAALRDEGAITEAEARRYALDPNRLTVA